MNLEPLPNQVAQPSEWSLKDYLQVLRRRKAVFMQVFVLVLAVGIVVTALGRPIYQSRAKIAVIPIASTMRLEDTKDPISSMLVGAQPHSVGTQLQVIQSEKFLGEARAMARVVPRPGIAAPDVRAEALRETNVIQITVEGGLPAEIKALARAVVDLHIQKTGESTSQGLQQAIKHLTAGQKKAMTELHAAEAALINFQRNHQIVRESAQRDAEQQERLDLEAKVREATDNVDTTRGQVAQMQAELDRLPPSISQESSLANERIPKLQERLADLQLQRETALVTHQETSQLVRSIDTQIRTVEAQLRAQKPERIVVNRIPNPLRPPLQSQLAELRASLYGYESALNAARARIKSRQTAGSGVEEWQVRLASLTQRRDAAQAAYNDISRNLRNLELRNIGKVPLVEEIEPPSTPRSPIRPNRVANILFFAVLAACVAGGMAYLQEYLDDRVNSPDDVERVAALPTLGHVPMLPGDQSRLVSTFPANSHIAESYRALRSSVGFASIDAPIRRLLVTSASKGEGKSMTSANLATAMAMDGKRVILVDADMRRPSVHRLFNISNAPGLSEILVGMRTIDESIQETDVENLRVISAGPIPPNPAELLGSRAFDHVIEQLELQADVVIFDSPPCIPVTDPLIIATRMQGVILVLHVGQTKKAAIKHVEGLLARTRARVLGVVFNRVEQNKSGYYYYQNYHYGDGYYAEANERGERRRRGGEKKPALGVGADTSRTRLLDGDDDL